MSDKQDILTIYSIIVNTITANEQRRQQAATIYLSLIVGLFTAFGSIKSLQAIYIAIPIFIIALIWFASICYFKRLAEAKFHVINELEGKLIYAPFREEWNKFKKLKLSKVVPNFKLTQLEMMIPAIIAVISFCYTIYWIFINYSYLLKQP